MIISMIMKYVSCHEYSAYKPYDLFEISDFLWVQEEYFCLRSLQVLSNQEKWGKKGKKTSQKSGFKVLGSKSLYYLIEVRNYILWRTCICKIHDDFKSYVYAYYILINVHRLCFLVNLLLLSILCQYRLQIVIFTLRLIHLQASKCIKLNFVF